MSEAKSTIEGMRGIVAFAVVAGLAVLASVSFFGLTEQVSGGSADAFGIDVQLRRFQPAHAYVKGGKLLGYFHDREPGSVAAQAAVAGAQYALAPGVLVVDMARDDVSIWIGDFGTKKDYAAEGRKLGLAMVADLGLGVVAFRKEGAR